MCKSTFENLTCQLKFTSLVLIRELRLKQDSWE